MRATILDAKICAIALVGSVSDNAGDPAVCARLTNAGRRFLGGDAVALDPGFVAGDLAVRLRDGSLPVAKILVELGLSSEATTLRSSALAAAVSSGCADVAEYLLPLDDKRMRGFDRFPLIFDIAGISESADLGTD